MAGLTRLILHSDSIASYDVNTFKGAAVMLAKIYKAKYPGDAVKVEFVRNGKDMVNYINRIGVGKLTTLDIVSHGNQGGIHIARKLAKPEKSGLIQRNAHELMRKFSDKPQSAAKAEYMEESMHGLYSDTLSKVGSRTITIKLMDDQPILHI